ncbi:MAG TPA: hypothetical protein VMG82_15360, partial [Candidatus Sulfotelmatobacter sp.]|nr:hypothetical protein [Candidatus Sulfotelmatobacter sp.]
MSPNPNGSGFRAPGANVRSPDVYVIEPRDRMWPIRDALGSGSHLLDPKRDGWGQPSGAQRGEETSDQRSGQRPRQPEQ